jgi:glycerol-3-phosphate acyltransferase PlsY
MGKKWGIVVLTLDALKGYIVVDLAHHVGNQTYCNVIAAVAILAHCYPIYLKFRGGKGVATTLGAVAALSWITLGLLVAVFLLVFVISRRISPSSLTAALALPVTAHFLSSDIIWPLGIFVAAIIWWKHRENLHRLIKNQEPRFF